MLRYKQASSEGRGERGRREKERKKEE